MADDRRQSRIIESPTDILDDLVAGRRSVRKYKKDSLPDSLLGALLECAHKAPSPSNSQPVRFIHICSGQHVASLNQALTDGHRRLIAKHKEMDGPARLRNWINAYYRYAQVMFAAPHLLAVGATTQAQGFSSNLTAAGLFSDQSRHQTDVDMTVGMALQNMMLKAHALGVGSCILTAPLVFMDDVEKVLALEKITIKCFVTLGIPDETPKDPGRVPLSTVVQVI